MFITADNCHILIDTLPLKRYRWNSNPYPPPIHILLLHQTIKTLEHLLLSSSWKNMSPANTVPSSAISSQEYILHLFLIPMFTIHSMCSTFRARLPFRLHVICETVFPRLDSQDQLGITVLTRGSTRTLTSSSPTPHDSRNDSTPTPTRYLHSTSPSHPSRSGRQVQISDGSPSTLTGHLDHKMRSPITSTPIKNIFRLGPTSAALSPKPSSSTSKPALKLKGPKPKTSRRQSRPNLVPAEYHTVEFETRMTGLGSGGESDVDIDVDRDRFGEGGRRGGSDGELDGRGDARVVPELDGTRGDGFVEEAARRGGPKGGDFDDDEAWVDIVVTGYGAHRVSVEASKRNGGPEEASQEVARVLSAVKRWTAASWYRRRREYLRGNSATSAVKVNSESDDVEVQMVPRFGKDRKTGHGLGGQGHHDDQSYTQSSKQFFTSGGDLDPSYTSESYNFPDADTEEDPEFKPLTWSVPNRRLGDFDLHPEEKRASQKMLRQITIKGSDDDLLNVRQPEAISSRDAGMFAPGSLNGHSDIDDDVDADDIEAVEVGEVDEDDPRARYAHGSDDEHDDAPRDLDKLYAAETEKARPLPSLPPDQKSGSFSTSTTFSSLPATSPPPRSSSLPHSPAPSLASSNPSPVPVSNLSALTSIAPIVALSPTPPAKPSVLTSTFGSTSGTSGKTAALIEMYREKEKKSLTLLRRYRLCLQEQQ
ncbi:hypothetical protein C8J55DRAFT_562092 [Lentinula edodes]|uniref:Uncharacterized protein n=1 Tax=Lentinula lateritia TaxID=40482 RepID=A0A9W9A757_9AGAR|nr:hypothetical protein C8J55DRAFT_562092 [Lentinula edodes]